jgi:hypothetical protein
MDTQLTRASHVPRDTLIRHAGHQSMDTRYAQASQCNWTTKKTGRASIPTDTQKDEASQEIQNIRAHAACQNELVIRNA